MTSECPIPDLDPNYNTDCLLMQSLRHTYPAFFQKFGRFTQIQRDAIPFIQKGDHALLVSGTATGKTEAACAPIIERNLLKTKPWTILYICPTRALVNDIYYRLYHPAQMLDISLKRRTGDHRDHLARIPNIIKNMPITRFWGKAPQITRTPATMAMIAINTPVDGPPELPFAMSTP